MPRYSLLALLLTSACSTTSDAPLEDGTLPGADPVLPNATGCGAFEEDLALSNQRELEDLDAQLSSETPNLDHAALRQFALQYLRAWTVHRAPHVVAGEVDGLGEDCTRSAIVAQTQYAILHDFRQNAPMDHLTRDGQYQRGCGQRRILATGRFAPASPPAPLGCVSRCLSDFSQGTEVVAELRDTPRSRGAVAQWIQASQPLLIAHVLDPGRPPEISRLAGYAPWSANLSVLQGLSIAQGIADVTVLTATSGPQGHRVTLQAEFYFEPEPLRLALAFECGDSRLLEVGSRWLLPFVYDPFGPSGLQNAPRQALEGGALFFLPGLAFEPEGPFRGILLDLRATARAPG